MARVSRSSTASPDTIFAVANPEDDWRLTGQERYLSEAELTRKPYKAPSATWEHDHCEFCWSKFMDAEVSPEHRAYMASHPEVLGEGYATTAGHPDGADAHWVCSACFDDFSDRFGWHIVDS